MLFNQEAEYLVLSFYFCINANICLFISFLGAANWQTYVLDVHPFNPRIAMSAGYDGKTILWDVSYWCIYFSNLLTLVLSYLDIFNMLYS